MTDTLNYGNKTLSFIFPDHAVNLKIKDPEFSVDKAKFTKDLLRKLPAGTASYSRIGIVVSDKTRLCGYPRYLPWLTELLEEKGVSKENLTFYIAYGTHPKQTEEESIISYGNVYHEYNFVHHDCYDEAALTKLGTTTRGTDVKVRRDVLESSLIITFGAISHHYFAGYGGGRKLLFPGLADRKSIYHNHSLFLDREKKKLSEGCQPGNLTGNPVAEDLREIDSYMPVKVSIHAILNSRGEVVDLIAGNTWEDFEDACRVHDSYYRTGLEEQYDIVIASSGGYPKDINFIQAHKSIHHAAAFVKDGGRLIILSECRDGIASDYFLKYLESGSFRNAYNMLEENYEGNGGTALSMMTKTSRINISMMTSLDEKLCKILNVEKINSEQVQEILNNTQDTIAVISNASLLVK